MPSAGQGSAAPCLAQPRCAQRGVQAAPAGGTSPSQPRGEGGVWAGCSAGPAGPLPPPAPGTLGGAAPGIPPARSGGAGVFVPPFEIRGDMSAAPPAPRPSSGVCEALPSLGPGQMSDPASPSPAALPPIELKPARLPSCASAFRIGSSISNYPAQGRSRQWPSLQGRFALPGLPQMAVSVPSSSLLSLQSPIPWF